MKELLQKMFKLHKGNVENNVAPQPSPFVLREGKRTGRRLIIDEKIPLDPGPCDPKEPEHSKITSLVFSPQSTYLILHTEYEPIGYTRSEWGFVETKHYKTKKEGWANSFTESALHLREGKMYINGSSVYFDDEKKQLHGPGWILEYRPLESSS